MDSIIGTYKRADMAVTVALRFFGWRMKKWIRGGTALTGEDLSLRSKTAPRNDETGSGRWSLGLWGPVSWPGLVQIRKHSPKTTIVMSAVVTLSRSR